MKFTCMCSEQQQNFVTISPCTNFGIDSSNRFPFRVGLVGWLRFNGAFNTI